MNQTLLATSNLTPLRLYDNSRISDFRRCARYYLYRHVWDWVPDKKSYPLIFGSGWHAGMDVVWRRHKAEKPEFESVVQEAYQAFLTSWVKDGAPPLEELSPDNLDDLGARTPQVALEMFYEYIEARQHLFKDPSFELLEIEEPFAVPLDPNDASLWYVGRLDKKFKHRGKYYVGEHKCLGKGTRVLKYDGTVCLVENISVGDLLMGPDSQSRKVAKLYSGTQQLYKVTPVKGQPYIVNESHILSLKMTGANYRVRCGEKSFGAGEIANVSVLDYLQAGAGFRQNAKGWRSGVDFEPREGTFKLPPYLLGLWLGDGNSANQGITSADEEIVDCLKKYAEDFSLEVRTVEGNNCATYYLHVKNHSRTENHFLSLLKRLDVIDNKHIPHSYKTASREDRLELLAGLIDTDGNAQHGGYRITQKNLRLAADICFVARSLGLAAYFSTGEAVSQTGFGGTYYYIYISGDCSVIPCRLPRKKLQPRQAEAKNVLVTGITVEPTEIGEYFGFEIEGPDHLFLLGDFTVTHNTTTSYRKGGPFRNDFLDSFSPNSQIDGYLYRMRMEYGNDSGGVRVDAALVHKQVHDGFKFIPEDHQFAQIDSWLWTTHYWIDQIEANKAILAERSSLDMPYLAAFPQNTNSCGNYGGCPYADICRAVANPAKLEGKPPLGYHRNHWSPFSEIKLEKIGFTAERSGETFAEPSNKLDKQPKGT